MFFRRARTPGFGTNGGGRDETDGNVYASPARLREENRKKKIKSIRRRVCKREERVRDSVVFCRYREIYATCCMRVRTCVKCVYLAFFVGAFFDREIICSFLRNRRRFLYCARVCSLFIIIIVGRLNVGRQ
ncbi:unnamed protein product [Aphis gossypii]|uniref:Uncharacterized protein n=1 Tax=Aphis gossypii TaxID=80765 RepID=A0A9P0IKI5_APHGO|nr:unnamed protein product [Aphis gossypii]